MQVGSEVGKNLVVQFNRVASAAIHAPAEFHKTDATHDEVHFRTGDTQIQGWVDAKKAAFQATSKGMAGSGVRAVQTSFERDTATPGQIQVDVKTRFQDNYMRTDSYTLEASTGKIQSETHRTLDAKDNQVADAPPSTAPAQAPGLNTISGHLVGSAEAPSFQLTGVGIDGNAPSDVALNVNHDAKQVELKDAGTANLAIELRKNADGTGVFNIRDQDADQLTSAVVNIPVGDISQVGHEWLSSDRFGPGLGAKPTGIDSFKVAQGDDGKTHISIAGPAKDGGAPLMDEYVLSGGQIAMLSHPPA